MVKEQKIGIHRGPPGFGGTIQKPKNFKKTFRVLLTYIKPYTASFIFITILSILGTLFNVFSPKILGNMTDIIVSGISKGKIDFIAIKNTAIILITLYSASSIFSYIQVWIMSAISQKVTYNLRKDISLKISKLPLKYFDSSKKGDIVSRAINDVEVVSQNLNQGLSQMISSLVTVVGILIIMITTNWQLALISIFILPVSFISMKSIIKKSQKNYDIQQESLGDMDSHIEEMFSNHLVVKIFNGEEESINKFNNVNDKLYNSNWKSQFLSGLMMPITTVINHLGYVAVVITGGWMAISGRVTIGNIQTFIQYMNQFTQPITQVANIANIIQATVAAAERIFEFLDEDEEEQENNKVSAPKYIDGKVEFKNVCFSYKKGNQIIKNFNAKIRSKCNVAIVGPTGAGKTTIVNLLMRFYDVDSGSISIDGIDINNIKRQDVRKMFGMVLQDTWLFNGTIADNIAFGKPDATMDEIVNAAKEAHADHFIRTLPDGYNTIIADSIDNISSGEKQLLTIARALLADAPMLILDEATSSVDTRTESAIQSAMDKLTDGRTSFVIAHRLSTIKNAELILVMKDGNIVEQGKHKELLEKNGFYASIYNSQFEEVV